MFEIEIDRSFAAAHQLKGYEGDCRNLHGHNYGVTVTVVADKLNDIGIALDFKLLKAAVDDVIGKYVQKMFAGSRGNADSDNINKGISLDFLESNGF